MQCEKCHCQNDVCGSQLGHAFIKPGMQQLTANLMHYVDVHSYHRLMHPFAIEGQTLLPFDSTSTTFSSREKQTKREVHAVPYTALMLPGFLALSTKECCGMIYNVRRQKYEFNHCILGLLCKLTFILTLSYMF